jgi:hypothetical protein
VRVTARAALEEASTGPRREPLSQPKGKTAAAVKSNASVPDKKAALKKQGIARVPPRSTAVPAAKGGAKTKATPVSVLRPR